MFARIAVTFVIAVASYKLVEMPVREGALSGPGGRIAGATVAVATLLLVLVGTAGSKDAETELAIQEPVEDSRSGDLKALLVGDSVALSLGSGWSRDPAGLDMTVRTTAIIGRGVARGPAGPLKRPLGKANEECEQWPERWISEIESLDPDVSIVLIGAWEAYDRKVGEKVLAVGSHERASASRAAPGGSESRSRSF